MDVTAKNWVNVSDAEEEIRDVNAGGFNLFEDALDQIDLMNTGGYTKDGGGIRDVSSTFAFLIGVPEKIFDNEHEPPKREIYDKLSSDNGARIIRSLCILRTAIERNFSRVCKAISQEYKTIMTCDFIPQESIQFLSDQGINLYRDRKDPNAFLIAINQNIKSRIYSCKEFFPVWVKWEYVRELFIMPNGLTVDGIKAAANDYYARMANLPYQVYMNCLVEDDGNILYNDRKFLKLLYKWNGDEFTDVGHVTDVTEDTKENVYKFLLGSKKTVFVVDCENSDPYSLCAAIKGLKKNARDNVDRIILYDDIHASTAWEILKDHIDIPIEYELIERIKSNKSLTDIKLTTRICKEFYSGNADSFVLVSSDSDYWGMIDTIEGARFLVMAEHAKFSGVMEDALRKKGIFYCYIDDFYAGAGDEIKTKALLREVNRLMEEKCKINVNDLMQDAMALTRVQMAPTEKKGFETKYLQSLILTIDEDGTVQIHTKGVKGK